MWLLKLSTFVATLWAVGALAYEAGKMKAEKEGKLDPPLAG